MASEQRRSMLFTNQNTPIAVEVGLDSLDCGPYRFRVSQPAGIGHPDVSQDLGILGDDLPAEIRQAATRGGHHLEQSQRREEAIAGYQIVEKDDMTGLLAAEGGAVLPESLENVPVANLGLDQRHADGVHSFAEPEVRHDRGDHGVVPQPAPFM